MRSKFHQNWDIRDYWDNGKKKIIGVGEGQKIQRFRSSTYTQSLRILDSFFSKEPNGQKF